MYHFKVLTLCYTFHLKALPGFQDSLKAGLQGLYLFSL